MKFTIDNNVIGNGITSEELDFITKAGDYKFFEAHTIAEANEYAKIILGLLADYKGCDVAVANEWNKGMTKYFNKFPVLKEYIRFIGETHQRNKFAREAYANYQKKLLEDTFPGLSRWIKFIKVNKEVNKFMKGLSVDEYEMARSWSPEEEYFKHLRGITLNRDTAKNLVKMEASIKIGVELKYHPVGCDSLQAILDHEMGHQLDDLLGISNIPEIQNLYNSRSKEQLTEDLSMYAWKNDNLNRYREMIADAWSEYCCNPNPREIAKTVGEIIIREYNKKFPA